MNFVYLLRPFLSFVVKGIRIHVYKDAGKIIITGGKLGVRYGSFLFKKMIGL